MRSIKKNAIRTIVICCVAACFSKAEAQRTPELATLQISHDALPVKIDSNTINAQINQAVKIIDINNDSAIALFQDAAAKSKRIGYKLGYVDALKNIGWCYIKAGNYETSLHYYRQAKYNAEQLQVDRLMLARIYSSMSIPFYYKGIYDSMGVYSYRATKMIEGYTINNANTASAILNIYNVTSGLWLTLSEADKAMYYLQKANALAIRYGDTADLGSITVNIGYAFFLKDKYDSAILYFQKPLTWHNAYPQTVTNARIGLGKSYIFMKQPEKAVPLLKEAVAMAQQANYIPVMLDASFTLGNAYYKVNDYAAAEKTLKTALQKAQSINLLNAEEASDSYKILATIYASQGKYKEAFEAQQNGTKILDSLQLKEKVKNINELELKYKTAEKDKQLAQSQLLIAQQQNHIKDRNILVGGTSAGIIILVLLLGSQYRRYKHKQKLQAEKMRFVEQARNMEQMQAMIQGEEKERARIGRELHDGIMSQFLAVKLNIKALKNNYPALAESSDYENILQQMAEASEDLRNTSHRLMPEILLHGLPEAIRIFCEKINQGQSVKLDFQLYDEIPPLEPEFSLSVYRIVQELVQNIVKHASAKEALIQIDCRNNLLTLTVEDDGVGFVPTTNSGAGLKNVYERVKALNGTIDIESNPQNGTAVYVELELRLLEITD